MPEDSVHVLVRVACFVGPLLAAPVLVVALRPLYALFLREGLELFSEQELGRDLALGIAQMLVIANVIIFAIGWWSAAGFWLIAGTLMGSTLLLLVGVLFALVATVVLVQRQTSITGRPSVLVALLVFAGGNLPIFLFVPAVLVFW